MWGWQAAANEGRDEGGAECANECDQAENNSVHKLKPSYCRSNTAFDTELVVKLSERSVFLTRGLRRLHSSFEWTERD